MTESGLTPLNLLETQEALSRPPKSLHGAPEVVQKWMDLGLQTQTARLARKDTEVNKQLLAASDAEPEAPTAPGYRLWAADNFATSGRWKDSLKTYDSVIAYAEKAEPLLPGIDFGHVARRGQAEARAAAGDATGAIRMWRELWQSGNEYETDAEGMLLAGLLAEDSGQRDEAADCYGQIAAKREGPAFSPHQLALRAARRMEGKGCFVRSVAACRSAVSDAIIDRDASALEAMLSTTHFSIGVVGGHFRFEDVDIRERVIAELSMRDAAGGDVLLGSGDKRYLFSEGWEGDLLRGRVGLVFMLAPQGWECTGVVLTEVGDEFQERWGPKEIQKNQPLPFTLRAPWPSGDNLMAGGVFEFGLKTAAVAAAAAGTPFGLGGAALALGFSLSDCGFGPRGFYYNDVSDTHQDEDAFAIDFTRYRRGIPFDNESGGTAVLAPAPGIVVTANGGRDSGDSNVSNTVEIDHADPTTGDVDRFRSRYLHLAGPNLLSVSVGMPVITGQRLGRMNDTGNSVLDHLHFSIHDQTAPSGNPQRGLSVRPTPMDGTALGDSGSGTCVLSSNRERRPPPLDNAEFVRQTVPATLSPFEQGAASFTFRNSGPTTWTAGYRLVTLAQGWTVDQRTLGQQVLPGQEITVGITLVALSPGDFDVQWRMSRQFSGQFGEPSRRVTVSIVDRDNPNDCDALDQAFNAALSEKEMWQNMLQTASPGQKPGIVDKIQQIQGQLTAIQAQKDNAGCP
ncbi:MAG: peptidoglycan DD-metalloendopeptidase family protein [Thermoanaerobaculia bacterium]